MPIAVIEPAGARTGLILFHDVLLDDAPAGQQPARLADVWILGETIGRIHDVGTQLEFGMSKIVLQPVQECQRRALGCLQDARQVARLAIENRFGRIVLPRPVHERDLGGLHAQPPPAEERARRHVVGDRRILAKHRVLDDALPAVLHRIVHAQREILPLADRIIVLRFGDGVILAPIAARSIANG